MVGFGRILLLKTRGDVTGEIAVRENRQFWPGKPVPGEVEIP